MTLRNKAFVSYSRADAAHLKRLQVHLAPYIREKKIDVWDDTRITPGAHWKEEIKQAIALAKVAILLVSADFMASEFIAQNELPPLLASAELQGTLVLSVILSHCSFEWSTLARYQSLNPPSLPLVMMPPGEQEAIWARLAKYVTDILAPESSNGAPSQTNPLPESIRIVTTQRDEDRAGSDISPDALVESLNIDIDNHIALFYAQKAEASLADGEYEEALHAYESALRFDPYNHEFYREKAIVLEKLARYDEALEAYQQALDLQEM